MAIIDFTLSRLDMETGGVAFCNLAADPELFEGTKGDCQVLYPSPPHHNDKFYNII